MVKIKTFNYVVINLNTFDVKYINVLLSPLNIYIYIYIYIFSGDKRTFIYIYLNHRL